jgi:hypothetical protein
MLIQTSLDDVGVIQVVGKYYRVLEFVEHALLIRNPLQDSLSVGIVWFEVLEDIRDSTVCRYKNSFPSTAKKSTVAGS